MNDPIVKFPVVCPVCGHESLATVPVATLAAALLSDSRIVLRTKCHNTSWTASAREIEQIRQYLAAPSMGAVPMGPDMRRHQAS